MEDLHRRHKVHRNVLYALVVILVVVQIVSFVVISSEVSKVRYEMEERNRNLSAYFTNLIERMDLQNQNNFNDITKALTTQADKFENVQEEVSMLKSSSGDFSGIIEGVVQSVVAIRGDRSLGTGFIVHPEGYVVTNEHVIRGAAYIEVITSNKKSLPAEMIGYDALKDVALLKLNGTFESLDLADSDKLQAGRKVIAIGNPLGLSFTVTEGIVSGLDRMGPSGKKEYIQTDVPLNPGNSGGPLIDTQGEVVGINNFKIGEAESLGFALKSNSLREAINSIANTTLI